MVHGIRREKLESAKSVLIDARVKPVIILNSSLGGATYPKAPFNQLERFVIAHELGHLVLHRNGGKHPSGPSEYWRIERLCDEFARRLLIPDESIPKLTPENGASALEQLRASVLLSQKGAVPWSAAARRISETQEGVFFFRLDPMRSGGFKVVVSTRPHHRGIGQHITPGTALCETLSERLLGPLGVHEVEPRNLSGIAGITDIQSSAAYSSGGGLRLAVVPA